ncbi:MAG TPA: hypothetical protein DEQ77_10130 [Candidatus Omnitrophica bacterium]|nr:hypothetical protein [Candidatus Omnitrophota bacterium]
MAQIENLKTENKYKKTEIGEIPVSWGIAMIRDVCRHPEYGYTASAVEEPVGPKMLRITDIQEGRVLWDTVPYCRCPENMKNKFLLHRGDILFARTGATTGKSYLIEDCPETVFASYLIRIVTERQLDYRYLYFVFDSAIYWNQIKQKIGGSAQGGVNASLLSELQVPLPPIPEQKKIAEILLTIDSAIDKISQLIEKKKELKKGLMQELLTHGIGHKKFYKTEIGEIPKGWEVSNLGDIAKIRMGQSPASSACFDYENGLPFFQGKAEFGTKYPNATKWCNSPTKIAERGDILISVRAPVGDINIALEKCCIGRGLSAVRGDQARQDFLYFVINFLKDKLAKAGQGSTFEAINKEVLFELKIPLPPCSEQKKIAEILSDIDADIEQEVSEKEKMKQLKKGLMQVLLTGKVRVKI